MCAKSTWSIKQLYSKAVPFFADTLYNILSCSCTYFIASSLDFYTIIHLFLYLIMVNHSSTLLFRSKKILASLRYQFAEIEGVKNFFLVLDMRLACLIRLCWRWSFIHSKNMCFEYRKTKKQYGIQTTSTHLKIKHGRPICHNCVNEKCPKGSGYF